MANTSSAKKAARQALRRAEINKNRKSRVRTFVRKVEEAIASGDASRGAGGAQGRATRIDAGRAKGRAAQANRVEQSFAALRAREEGGLKLGSA